MILKNGAVITASQARELITSYGVNHVVVDGLIEPVLASELNTCIEDEDAFTVEVNYAYNVALRYQDAKIRMDIPLLNLSGRCGELVENGILTVAQWYADVLIWPTAAITLPEYANEQRRSQIGNSVFH